MDHSRSDTHLGPTSAQPVDAGGFAPGTVLADRYRIVAMLGRGGMGEVYRADDLRLNQPVALKFLPASLERDAKARERLLAEVRNARSVSHPNVCRVYDVGEVQGRTFLTMEYIDGEDLASLLKRVGRLSPPKALEVARQLVAGLAAAHDKGLLHRDLKPANVMLDGQGRARLTDFGLSVEAAPGKSPEDFAGTVGYMAPERFEGKPATVRSDLYALGLVLYEACTGQAALRSTTMEGWRRAHSDSTPTAPSAVVAEIDRALERAILWCLEKDPAKRPASAAQLAVALPGGDPLAAMIAAGETPSPELVAASGEEGTLPRAKAWTWLAACLVLLAVVPFTWMPFNLTERVRFDLGPEALQARARDVLQRLGYADQPADRSWWFRTDEDYLERVNRLRPGEAAADLRSARPGPLLFCYRQSPAPLIPATVTGVTTAEEPPPQAGDVYVELDSGGRLVALRVEPPDYGSAQPSSRVNWAPLFDAAQLGPPDTFVQAAPRWWPRSAPDVRDAWEGVYAGQQVRVDAAARAGRPIFSACRCRGQRPRHSVLQVRVPRPTRSRRRLLRDSGRVSSSWRSSPAGTSGSDEATVRLLGRWPRRSSSRGPRGRWPRPTRSWDRSTSIKGGQGPSCSRCCSGCTPGSHTWDWSH
jgi:serine/threonine-protein kinase